MIAKLRTDGVNARRIFLIGSAQENNKVVAYISSLTTNNYIITGMFSDDESSLELTNILSGTISFGIENANLNYTDQIWLTIPLNDEEKIGRVMNELQGSMIEIKLLPNMRSFSLFNLPITYIGSQPIINLSASPIDGINSLIKFVEDKILSAAILLLVTPAMLAIAILVKLNSPGPIFYSQERMSWNGKKFRMIKFRSMPVDTEEKTGVAWAKEDDNRATTVGRFLRKTSLDELPQFWNVLKGDMSVVGPRPERPVFVDKFKQEIPRYMQKHKVKAGITGWAQINGWRGNTDLEKRIEYDIHYIENWSLLFDLKIIYLTLAKGFNHPNAY